MLPLPLLDSHRPPVRVMALHALAYCRRLFYLEEVEEIRVTDARVFAGRQLHAALEAEDEGESVSLELASDALGLVGKVLSEIDEGEWSKLYSATSVPFAAPAGGKIAVKVVNHYGDEVLKVYTVE